MRIPKQEWKTRDLETTIKGKTKDFDVKFELNDAPGPGDVFGRILNGNSRPKVRPAWGYKLVNPVDTCAH